MREIKFRAWDVENQEMIDADSLAFDTYAPLCDQLRDSDEMKFMQFTGMKDKNGVEIYEGDRLLINVRKDNQVIDSQAFYGEQGVAELTPSGTCFGEWDAVYCTDSVIVGNIYQNPGSSDASQDIKDAVANLDPGIRKRIDDSLKVVAPPNLSFSGNVLTDVGIVHSRENVVSTNRRDSATTKVAK